MIPSLQCRYDGAPVTDESLQDRQRCGQGVDDGVRIVIVDADVVEQDEWLARRAHTFDGSARQIDTWLLQRQHRRDTGAPQSAHVRGVNGRAEMQMWAQLTHTLGLPVSHGIGKRPKDGPAG